MKYFRIIILGAGFLGIFFYFLSPGFSEKNIPLSPFERIPPAGMLEYKSLIFRFSLFYPNDLKFKEYQGGSDTTVVFENSKTGKGFQIFVKPYEHEQISLDQLKMDLSSGIVKDPVDISVDGVGATMFYSQNSAIGDTREVWFVKNGFLYEVTTYKELDAWLSSIMQTWKFLEF